MDELKDEELIKSCLNGNAKAFADLIHRYEKPLITLIRYEISDMSYAEDILQDTLLKAWLNMRNLKDAGKFKSWLYSIARNECKSHFRKMKTNYESIGDDKLELYVNKYGRQVRDKSINLVEEALEKVSEEDRKIINLFYYYGLTIKEISKHMGCTEGTIKRKLHYARNHIRDMIDN